MNYIHYCETLVSMWKDGHLKGKTFTKYNREFKFNSFDDIKRFIKTILKKEYPTLKVIKPITLINEWESCTDDGETKFYVGIFKKTDNTMREINQYIYLEGNSNHYDFSPTGLWFADPANVKELDDRIIVTQTISLDC